MEVIFYTTKQAAAFYGVQTGTLRRGLWSNGNYMGVKPVKMPNGRLAWKIKEVHRSVGLNNEK